MTYITREHVIWAYRIILDREPESESSINTILSMTKTVDDLTYNFLNSEEYKHNITFKNIINSEYIKKCIKCVFLHIPKVFGTSFSNLLEKNYEYEYAKNITLLNSKYTSREFAMTKVYGGHFNFTMFKNIQNNTIFITAVRDPVSRAISLHNFYNERSIVNYLDSLYDIITNPGSNIKHEFINNYQCKMLSGYANFEKTLEVIKENNFLIGVHDFPQYLADLCSEKLHWKYRNLEKINIADSVDYQNKYISNRELMSYLEENNKEDRKLYEYIYTNKIIDTCKKNFDIEKIFPNNQ